MRCGAHFPFKANKGAISIAKRKHVCQQLKQLEELFWPHRRAHWDQEGVNDDGTMG